jgi:signal transduction histidine kinase
LLNKLGRPFVTTKPAGIGTCLGLSISQEIIKRHGGELRIASRQGEFTEVTVALPAV